MRDNVENLRTELLTKWEEYQPKGTPVLFTKYHNISLAVKDESVNLTGTYKARHGWKMGWDYLTNHFPYNFIYYLGSTGNAGIADFAFADLLNDLLGEERVVVANFYPKHYDTKLLGPDSQGRFTDGKRFREEMEKYRSGRLIQVDFKEKYWFDNFESENTPCLDRMIELGLDARRDNSLDITEGFKPTYNQIMEEYVTQIKGCYGYVPRTLAIIQFGAGMLYDDSKAVALSHNWPIDFMAVSTGNKKTIADKICDSSETWQRSLKELREVGFTTAKNSGDLIHQIDEQEILLAMQMFKELRIEAEPSGAAGMAMVPRILPKIKDRYDLIAIINTGNGVKETAYSSLINKAEG
ncbi:MAG: hypothetical protein WCV90_04800 [Candidatus Woesearchaeota archaeon]|jgi:hypothetical protein